MFANARAMSSAGANLRLTSVIYLAKAFSFGLSFIIRTKSERFCDNIIIDKTQNNRPKPELLIGIVPVAQVNKKSR